MTRLLSTEDLWETLRRLSRTTTNTHAAVAYFTDPGDLVLRSGDLLVVDASEESIRLGRTSASALNAAYEAGVRLYSLPKLHAKIMVLDDTVVCGSANLSRAARETLHEAGVVSELPELRNQALLLIETLRNQAEPLDGKAIKKLQSIPVVRQGGATSGEQDSRNPTLLEALRRDDPVIRNYLYVWVGGEVGVSDKQVRAAIDSSGKFPKTLDRDQWTWSTCQGKDPGAQHVTKVLQGRPAIWFHATLKDGLIDGFTELERKRPVVTVLRG